MSVGLALFANAKSWSHRLMISFASGILILLSYLAIERYREARIQKSAVADVIVFLTEKGPMSFQDIYANISPQHGFEILSEAINSAILEGAISAKQVQARLVNNQIVGVRVYSAKK